MNLGNYSERDFLRYRKNNHHCKISSSNNFDRYMWTHGFAV